MHILFRRLLFVLATSVLFLSCLSEEIRIADFDGNYAVALVDTEINIVELVESANQEVIVSKNEEEQLTISYLGDVVDQSVFEIFPPVPWFQEIPLIDTAALVPLPFQVMFTIKKAKFFGTIININAISQFDEDVAVTFRFPDVYKDGVSFEHSFVIPADESVPHAFIGDKLNLTDWELITETNEFVYSYDARLPSGERVELSKMAMFLEILNFSYIEGFFGERSFPVEGSVIAVGIFDKWLSGGFIFEDPVVRFVVENSFGFPVRTLDNKIEITTISGNVFQLEAEGLEEGIGFNYPKLDEVGEVKSTVFLYSSDNSNIGEAFNEKADSVSYSVNAVSNSEFDETVTGFLTDSSYYRVQVALDVPLHLTLNDLKLTDTFDIDLGNLKDFTELEFKFITENAFPFKVDLQTYLIDETTGNTVVLFENEQLVLESGDLESGGNVSPSPEATKFVTLSGDRLSKAIGANKIAIVATFSNSEISSDESFWVLSEYGIKLKLGAIGRNE